MCVYVIWILTIKFLGWLVVMLSQSKSRKDTKTKENAREITQEDLLGKQWLTNTAAAAAADATWIRAGNVHGVKTILLFVPNTNRIINNLSVVSNAVAAHMYRQMPAMSLLYLH